MKARQATMHSELFGESFFRDIHILDEEGSDSAIFDNIFELLVHAGRAPEHAFMMMIQEPFDRKLAIPNDKRAFYEFHSAMLEAWDGPAAMTFTDGKVVGAALDRNGLRPFRYSLSKTGYFVGASEAGVLDRDESEVELRDILRPGQMFLLDIQNGRLIRDGEIKTRISRQKPYRRWLESQRIELRGLFGDQKIPSRAIAANLASYFLYNRDTENILKSMLQQGQEANSAMTTKKPPAILARNPVPLYAYFRQRFAQVTNPPIDSYREAIVMSLENYIGTQHNLLEETPLHCHQVKLERPILSNTDMEWLRAANQPDFKVATVSLCFTLESQRNKDLVYQELQKEIEKQNANQRQHATQQEFEIRPDLEGILAKLCKDAEAQIDAGANLIILSDRMTDAQHASVPALLGVSAVHGYLVEAKKRHLAGLVVETGDARDVHEISVLLAYGASGVNPWLVFERIPEYAAQWKDTRPLEVLADNYIAAANKGILKIMSKLGISTVSSIRA